MFFISKKKFDDVVRRKVDNALYEQNRDQDIRRRFDENDRHLWDLDRRVSTLEAKAGIKINELRESAEWSDRLAVLMGRDVGDSKAPLMRKAADAIEELLAKVPKWISVEDEPPKENDRYLVRYKRVVNLGDEETVRDDEIRIMRFFVDDGWRYPIICNDHVRLVNEEVTHWMPLPEPPKEDAE